MKFLVGHSLVEFEELERNLNRPGTDFDHILAEVDDALATADIERIRNREQIFRSGKNNG